MSDYTIPPHHFKPPPTIHTEKLSVKQLFMFAQFIVADWITLFRAASIKINNKVILTFIRNVANQKVWLN